MPSVPGHCGTALQEFSLLGGHRLLSRTTRPPRLVVPRIADVPPPTASRRCGSALKELHCLLPPGSEAVHCRRLTADCLPVVWH